VTNASNADPQSSHLYSKMGMAESYQTPLGARVRVARHERPATGGAYPETNARRQFTAVPLLDEIVGDVRTPLRLMSFAIAAVLLLVCANVANLLLTRASWRRREMGCASRSAPGARVWCGRC
jgi:hypothetical protein